MSAADRERWRQIDELLQFALRQKEGDGDAFAHQACNGDKAPQRKISLLFSNLVQLNGSRTAQEQSETKQ